MKKVQSTSSYSRGVTTFPSCLQVFAKAERSAGPKPVTNMRITSVGTASIYMTVASWGVKGGFLTIVLLISIIIHLVFAQLGSCATIGISVTLRCQELRNGLESLSSIVGISEYLSILSLAFTFL